MTTAVNSMRTDRCVCWNQTVRCNASTR